MTEHLNIQLEKDMPINLRFGGEGHTHTQTHTNTHTHTHGDVVFAARRTLDKKSWQQGDLMAVM